MDTNDFEAVVDKDDTNNTNNPNNSDDIKNDRTANQEEFKLIKDFVPHSAKKLHDWAMIFLVAVVLLLTVDFIAMAYKNYILVTYLTGLTIISYILRRVFDAYADNVTYNARSQKLIELQTKMML